MVEATRLLHDRGALDITSLERADSTRLLEKLTDMGWSSGSTPYLGLKLSLPPSAVGKLTNLLSDPARTPEAQHLINLKPLLSGVVADPGFRVGAAAVVGA